VRGYARSGTGRTAVASTQSAEGSVLGPRHSRAHIPVNAGRVTGRELIFPRIGPTHARDQSTNPPLPSFFHHFLRIHKQKSPAGPAIVCARVQSRCCARATALHQQSNFWRPPQFPHWTRMLTNGLLERHLPQRCRRARTFTRAREHATHHARSTNRRRLSSPWPRTLS
jgi:hypothetical protein